MCPEWVTLILMSELQAWMSQAIRAESAARGLSVRQLALKAGIPDKVLRRALDCERAFHLEQLEKIAAALGVSLTFVASEAERRQSLATPLERAAAKIEGDLTLSRADKNTLLR
jgi:lambda repressor-like predicted transcriptional regulator